MSGQAVWVWEKRLAVRCAIWLAGVRSFARCPLGARSGFSDYASPLGSHIESFLTHRQMEMLSTYGKHMVKWYLALVGDPCLWIVRGSQDRYRTDREHHCLLGTSGRDPRGSADQSQARTDDIRRRHYRASRPLAGGDGTTAELDGGVNGPPHRLPRERERGSAVGARKEPLT